MKHSCKPAATPLGFSYLKHSLSWTTQILDAVKSYRVKHNKHSAHHSVDFEEHYHCHLLQLQSY
jgi:hypothetical protein